MGQDRRGAGRLLARGINISQVLDVMVVSTAAAAEIGKAVEGAMPSTRPKEGDRRELMRVAQLTLDAAISNTARS